MCGGASEMELDPGERIVLSTPNFVFVRLRRDGSLDPRFGDAGIARPFGEVDWYSRDMEVQSDGKIVVAGSVSIDGSPSTFVVARLLPDGSPDTAFGEKGMAVAENLPGSHQAFAEIDVLPDGRIALAGTIYGKHTDEPGMGVARFLPDGTPDQSFSRDGARVVEVEMGESPATVEALADGRTIVVGNRYSYGYETGDVVVIRLLENGWLDRDFGADGIALRTPRRDLGVSSATVDTNGRIVIAGNAHRPDAVRSNWMVGRLLRSGHWDRSFGSRGTVVLDLGDYDGATDLALTPDGRIVTSAKTLTADGWEWAATRNLAQ